MACIRERRPAHPTGNPQLHIICELRAPIIAQHLARVAITIRGDIARGKNVRQRNESLGLLGDGYTAPLILNLALVQDVPSTTRDLRLEVQRRIISGGLLEGNPLRSQRCQLVFNGLTNEITNGNTSPEELDASSSS